MARTESRKAVKRTRCRSPKAKKKKSTRACRRTCTGVYDYDNLSIFYAPQYDAGVPAFEQSEQSEPFEPFQAFEPFEPQDEKIDFEMEKDLDLVYGDDMVTLGPVGESESFDDFSDDEGDTPHSQEQAEQQAVDATTQAQAQHTVVEHKLQHINSEQNLSKFYNTLEAVGAIIEAETKQEKATKQVQGVIFLRKSGLYAAYDLEYLMDYTTNEIVDETFSASNNVHDSKLQIGFIVLPESVDVRRFASSIIDTLKHVHGRTTTQPTHPLYIVIIYKGLFCMLSFFGHTEKNIDYNFLTSYLTDSLREYETTGNADWSKISLRHSENEFNGFFAGLSPVGVDAYTFGEIYRSFRKP